MSRVNMGPPPPLEVDPLPDWYGVLELSKEASASAIRTAYKRLAFQYHPDKTLDPKLKPEMTKRFTQIQEAYEVLSDSRKKREYDEDLALETKIYEEYRRAQEMKERQARSRKAQQRNKEEEMIRKAEDRQAEMEYLAAKRQEEDLLDAAKRVQEARRQHAAADQKRKASVAAERTQEGERARRKEAKQESRRQREEEMHRAEAERRERERLQRDEDKKQYARDSEKRTRDRRQDRGQKDHMQFPIDDILDAEPLHFDRPEKSHTRGRSSKERLHEPTLHVPRDTSKVRDRSPRGRDGSRHRERDRESDFSTRDFESSRKHQFYESARRMSTEPLHEEYMRGPGSHYGSPPSSYTIPRSATYSPPSSPKLRHSNPTMNTSHSFSGPNKGRDRTRDRPGERSRKHSEAGLYARDSFPSSIPEDMNSSLPGNRDSGYSTDPRLSGDKLDSKIYSQVNGKKYKAKVMYVTDSEDDGTSTVGKSRSTKRATKQSSREDSHASYAPRHQPPVELDNTMLDDPFRFMQAGSKTFPYTHKDVNYSAKPTVIHTRSNSDHSSPPDITIDFINAGLAGMSTSGHKGARHVPPVGGSNVPTPGLNRFPTWAG
ncbi:hypothetical protein ABW21_db0206752 [Orbilia brochopaga]|nr:hypothetical protein ABW21_db0206752 [Drechslerella brochopaga]